MKLTEIIFLNDVIQKHRTQGAKVQMIMVRFVFNGCSVSLTLSPTLAGVCRRAGTSYSCSVLCTSTVRCLGYHWPWL